MDKTVFESFEDYLEEANYPQGKKKIMQPTMDQHKYEPFEESLSLDLHVDLLAIPYEALEVYLE